VADEAKGEPKPSDGIEGKPGAGKTAATGKPGGKESGFGKYKWWIIGGGLLLVGLFWYFSRNSGSTSAQTAASNQAAQSGIDPATGYLYGSPADIAALGGSGSVAATPGPQGPAGPAGPAGPTGPPGGSTGTGSTGTGSTGTGSTGVPAGMHGVSNQIASIFLSNKNVYNPSGGKSQGVTEINGKYYIGNLEQKELTAYQSKHAKG
jgi:hypothetical protein